MTAQEIEEKKTFEFAPKARIYAISSLNFGDNQLADAYGTNYGIGTSLSFFSLANFRPALNYELSRYQIVKPELTRATGNSSTFWSVFGTVAYDIPITKEVIIAPDFGIGYSQLTLGAGKTRFGNQGGTQFRAGLSTNYKFASAAAVFVGVHYIYTTLQVSTHPDFESYYNHGQQIQFAIGFQFGKK